MFRLSEVQIHPIMKSNPNRWQSLPGSFDALNTRDILYSDNQWGIPQIKKARAIPEWLAPYRTRFRSRRKLNLSQGGYHFFIPDHKIKCVWERPQVAIKFIQKLPVVLSPNFSLGQNSFAEQLLATYQNRWCGAWWQSQGLTVIPSISWADETSYDFCFAGVQSGSVVAISGQNYEQFPNGFDEMISRLSPVKILCLGVPPTCAPDLHVYPRVFSLRNIK